jgi:hypothetical protein
MESVGVGIDGSYSSINASPANSLLQMAGLSNPFSSPSSQASSGPESRTFEILMQYQKRVEEGERTESSFLALIRRFSYSMRFFLFILCIFVLLSTVLSVPL